jgi:glycosyltransferase involved in cell wall biosynthesis
VGERQVGERRRILLLIKCLGHGGAERLLVDMVRHRDTGSFDYEVAVVLASEDALVPEIEADGVTVHRLGARSNADVSWTLRLRRLLDAGRYDVLHSHLPYAAGLGRMVAVTEGRHRPMLVTTEHSLWNRMAVGLRILNGATAGLDDALVVVSEAARQALPRRLRARARVVVHGIDQAPLRALRARREELRRSVRAELGVPEGDRLAVTVANLRPEKAYDVLLDAAALLAQREVPVRIAAAGRGPLAAQLAARHAELGLGDRFLLLGPRDDARRLLAAADLFVLASRQEGLPVSVMEATGLGVPLVVTSVGELPRLAGSGSEALVVPPENPEALADAVGAVVADDRLRRALAEGSARLAERFDVTRCTAEVEALYRQLLADRPERRAGVVPPGAS